METIMEAWKLAILTFEAPDRMFSKRKVSYKLEERKLSGRLFQNGNYHKTIKTLFTSYATFSEWMLHLFWTSDIGQASE